MIKKKKEKEQEQERKKENERKDYGFFEITDLVPTCQLVVWIWNKDELESLGHQKCKQAMIRSLNWPRNHQG